VLSSEAGAAVVPFDADAAPGRDVVSGALFCTRSALQRMKLSKSVRVFASPSS
jgi:hypothetical protein